MPRCEGPIDRRRSTEYFGQGQSGYTAGRVEDDRALGRQLEPRNASYPPGEGDEHAQGLGTDERFLGAGRAPWAPAGPRGLDDARRGA
jgi:hypothetical protein